MMPSKETGTQQEAIWRLAQHVAGTRGHNWTRLRMRTRRVFVTALIERMATIRADLSREITGAELHETLFGPLAVGNPVSWTDTPQEVRELFIAAVQEDRQARELQEKTADTADPSTESRKRG